MKEPNWKAIVESRIWKAEIEPWLAELYMEALESQAPAVSSDPEANLQSYHFWRGYVNAIRQLRGMPKAEVERQHTE